MGFNLEQYAKMALERLGCQVRFVGYRQVLGRLATPLRIVISRSKSVRLLMEPFGIGKFNKLVRNLGCDFTPDLMLSIKGEAIHPSTVDWFSREIGTTTVLWYPDDPRYFHSLSKLIAPYYDFVFTPSEKHVAAYQHAGATHVEHLPFACEPSVHRPVSLSDHEAAMFGCEVCFVGTYSRKRAKLLRVLRRAGFKVRVWGPYWRYIRSIPDTHAAIFGPELARAFSAAKIVLNIHDDGDLASKPNMRVFEATACRSLLLSDHALGLEQYFTPGKEILCYNDEDDLVDQVNYYLHSPLDRAEIAAEANERAYRDHTYNHRLGRLLKAVS